MLYERRWQRTRSADAGDAVRACCCFCLCRVWRRRRRRPRASARSGGRSSLISLSALTSRISPFSRMQQSIQRSDRPSAHRSIARRRPAPPVTAGHFSRAIGPTEIYTYLQYADDTYSPTRQRVFKVLTIINKCETCCGPGRNSTPRVKNHVTKLLSISSLSNDRFSQFFHWNTPWKICNNVSIKYPTTPKMCRYATWGR